MPRPITPRPCPDSFVQKIISQPWNIDRLRGRSIIVDLIQRLRSDRPSEDDYGDPLPTMQILGDVAVIPITGTLMMNVPQWAKEWGINATDIDDITAEISQAQANPAVNLIVLDFDSPGGWSYAGQKLFDFVERSQARISGKPIFAWCADGADCGSAAYQGATPARMFLTGPYALAVGCIGSYQAMMDDTEMWDKLGVTFTVLRSGFLKGMGSDEITADQYAWVQSVVDSCGDLFRSNVARYRTALDPAEMQGQFYDGATAARLNFTHGTAADINAAIAKFRNVL